MSNFWNKSELSYINRNAIVAAIGLGGVLVWALAMDSNHKFMRQERVVATVVDVKSTKLDNRVKFKLPNGKHTTLSIHQKPLPKVGEKRPIFIYIYTDGENRASYDHMEWLLNY